MAQAKESRSTSVKQQTFVGFGNIKVELEFNEQNEPTAHFREAESGKSLALLEGLPASDCLASVVRHLNYVE
jgi:hypothetical protein